MKLAGYDIFHFTASIFRNASAKKGISLNLETLKTRQRKWNKEIARLVEL